MRNICVIGSMNVDLTIRLPRFHAPGETIIGEAFHTYAGGKGGNQAVAAAALGGKVLMVGKVGGDGNGAFYLRTLQERGIDTGCVETVPDASTGVALIEVDTVGENRIAIVPGANALVDRAQIDRLLPLLFANDCFLLQLEIPLETVCHAAALLHGRGKRVILDPAPARPLPDSLYRAVDYLTPNTVELEMLSGLPAGTDEETVAACRSLVAKGALAVVAKLGRRGCLYVDESRVLRVEGYAVDVVDTTAAGDSFNAGLAMALTEGLPLPRALAFANAAGALSTTAAGAQEAMPTREQALRLLDA